MGHAKFRHVERQALRMHEMMERLGVDACKLARLGQGKTYAAARIRCLDCIDTEKCLRWLECSGEHAERPEFCVNLELFDFCAKTPPKQTTRHSVTMGSGHF